MLDFRKQVLKFKSVSISSSIWSIYIIRTLQIIFGYFIYMTTFIIIQELIALLWNLLIGLAWM